MNRREFVRTTVAASVAATVPFADAATPPAKRNVLYVFSDQHRECAMPGKPHSPVVAPALDAFSKQNFVMENCISNYPLCAPHRAILVSGRWPQQTGVDGNGPGLPPTEKGLGEVFADAGYHTGYVGKWHLSGGENKFTPKGPNRFGFTDWRVWGNTNDHYHAYTWDQETGEKISPPGWNATSMTDEAITFIQGQKKEKNLKPWMLVVSWNPPHPPFNPPPEDEQAYAGKLPLRPNVRLTRSDGSRPPQPLLRNEQTLRDAERGYYGGITGVDKEFARILRALEDTGQADNTIVVYTSDHGEMMGAQARMSKIVPWEESCHVPFFVRVPGAKRGSSKELFSTIDIYPTLCGLAGIPVPRHCKGRDLSAVILGKPAKQPAEAVFLMANSGGATTPENDLPTYRGVRTPKHTYAVMETGRWLLYDNVADPFQQKNLCNDPTHRPLMEKFDGMIAAWQKESGDTFAIHEAAKKLTSFPS